MKAEAFKIRARANNDFYEMGNSLGLAQENWKLLSQNVKKVNF